MVVPARLEDVVQQCLQKDPSKRYSDVAALMADLREITGQPATVTHSSLPGSVSTTEASIITPRVTTASGPLTAEAPRVECSHCRNGAAVQVDRDGGRLSLR